MREFSAQKQTPARAAGVCSIDDGEAVRVGFAIVGETFLLEPFLHDAVVDDGAVTPGAHAETEIVLGHQHAHLARELARAVGNELDILQPLRLAPGVHDEGVVDGDAVDRVDALCLELVIELLEIGKLVGRAGRREGARQREQHHALAGEIVGTGLVFPPERVGSLDRLVAHAGAKGDIGHFFDGHLQLLQAMSGGAREEPGGIARDVWDFRLPGGGRTGNSRG